MYIYDEHDQRLVDERVNQYRGQTERYLAGEITDEQFLPLRLQNGLYVQRLAPMLRIAIPYGTFNSTQMRKLAHISRHYDKGYGHFSTRQNLQLNWPKLEEVPDILEELASVQMHAIQTSGNCIRNTTTDQFAGAAADELEDPRPYCEIIREWSTFHPEFAFLPRKFKIAVCASEADRAATQMHDIGIEVVHNAEGETGFRVLVGGGLGRTPVIATEIVDFLPKQHLITYLEAILRVYNQLGRRDNKYKARIKILVRAMGIEAFREKVEQEWATIKDGPSTLTEAEFDRAKSFFHSPDYASIDDNAAEASLAEQAAQNPAFANWLKRNVDAHQAPGYAMVTLSLKATGYAPGDLTDQQMEAVADMADQFSFGEIRASHQQNLILAHVRKDQLLAVFEQAQAQNFATANINYLTDMICCPGGDFCALANAKSLPVSEAIQRKFDDLDYLYDLGPIDLNISGCMNACGHHHIGHIGILGVDKKGQEFFQISLGGSQDKDASLAKILGPSFSSADVPDVVEKILDIYVTLRTEEESFLDTYRRVGIDPFKEKVYAK
ncbi:MAG: nitrite/sulfite reductase [Oceanicoccus sp.]|uniref:nitrite/sulfite reductase n=1 Tax=Oceanicoccus sp. TaxID=2691044 RepID=UPI00261D01CB|nr:nitrite/sulfite reductase [Oceanicoccus sp.]MCP3907765.1 nitrite/sulfite reductase [Oceanicoccus sp.]MDG1773273.1 nitrite/sulfite reductase [Oceanicoccus sp.]